jgi:hypothetical protein
MPDQTINCPKCGAAFALDAALAAPMLKQVEQQNEKRLKLAVEAAVADAQTAQYEAAAARVADKLKKTEDAAKRAADELQEARRLADAAVDSHRQLEVKLATAQQAQAAAVKHERELGDRERELNLTIEKQVSLGIDTARQAARRDADEANRLKLLEKDTLLQSMQTKIDELKQKAEQGSQQLQGEVQELDLEQQLRAKFPFDVIGEVAKGVNGADITQNVCASSGHHTGLILWESKRTKHWSDGWLAKLREDGRKAQADILVIVSAALPESVETFDFSDNVWVCSPKTALPVAVALRSILLAVHNTKQVQAGMATTAEEVYKYVTGSQFRHRVEALVEAFTAMQEDLTAEQKAAQRQWAKRAVQIERVLTSTSGMLGDLQGIAGSALPEPAGLRLTDGGVKWSTTL